jgi:hypothetical protein
MQKVYESVISLLYGICCGSLPPVLLLIGVKAGSIVSLSIAV